MATAQDQVRSLLRDDIAPILRAAGFRGTERSFAIPDPDWFAQIGVQTSTASTSALAKLTINVQVIPKAAWNAGRAERQYPARPSPNTHYGRVGEFWQVRAGELVDGSDRWWELDDRGTGRRQLAVELTDLIVDVVLPAMMSHMTSEPSRS
ncbi:DUF4304 domain-containing protein [Microbacterium algeriense]|uniref:DUF4304 domain-containing protein n=1 Tax=Microbacterium algeriense TaxID=2615184 RepID=UPI0022E7EAF7|nr:DUF4304 domain-containing protein [Microbacterium algeriense]